MCHEFACLLHLLGQHNLFLCCFLSDGRLLDQLMPSVVAGPHQRSPCIAEASQVFETPCSSELLPFMHLKPSREEATWLALRVYLVAPSCPSHDLVVTRRGSNEGATMIGWWKLLPFRKKSMVGESPSPCQVIPSSDNQLWWSKAMARHSWMWAWPQVRGRATWGCEDAVVAKSSTKYVV